MEIVYEGFNDDKLMREVAKYVDKAKWVLPPWMVRLTVEFDAGCDEETLARFKTNFTYRFGRLRICGSWVNDRPRIKMETIVHEFLHASTDLPTSFAEQRLLQVKDIPGLEMFLAEMRDRMEMGTEDLTQRIMGRLYPDFD